MSGSRRLLRELVTESPALLAVAAATAVIQSALLVPIALVVRSVFDNHLGEHHSGAIVRAGVVILLLYSAAALLGYLSRVTVLGSTTAVSARLRDDLVAKVHSLPQGWHDGQRAGLVHSMIVQDTERVERMLGELASPVLPAAVVAAALAVVALVLSPQLFLALLVVIPPLMGLMRLFGRRIRHRAQHWAASARAFGAEVHRMLRAVALTKVQGAEEQQARRARERTTQLAADMRVLGASRASHAAVQNTLGAVAGALVLIVGGIGVGRGSISLGDLLGFYAVLALLLRQLQLIGGATNDIVLGLESLDRLEAFLETPSEEPYVGGGAARIRFEGAVTLEDVGFAYASGRPVLRDVRLEVRPSERVAVVGPNGAGKSTLVSIVMGLYRPQSGRVLADGVAYSELDMRHFRRQIGVVLQDPLIFPGTIRDNIAFGRPDASDPEIREAATLATADAFIHRLPDGYDTEVGDEGVGLSGGQRQRIAIARALVGGPGLLMLDEPTTYLDEAAVSALMANLASLPRAPTVVLVTHDPQAATHADRVIELRDGAVAGDTGAYSWREAG